MQKPEAALTPMSMPSLFFLSHLPIPGMLFTSRKARVSVLFVSLCSPNTHSARLREHFNGLSFPAACWSTAEGTIWALNVTADVLGVPIGHHRPLFAPETKKNAPPGSTRESVVCRKGHQEDLRRFLRLKKIQVMRMVISIFVY